ncbi:MAG: hypothetical protein KAT34_04955 [Candidatus Aminicenantes bacterium]|nr:hypothetical protein [Candidatus Aminicenantes bacterium]
MIKKIGEPVQLRKDFSENNMAKAYSYFYVLISYLLCFGTTLFVPVDPGYKMLLQQSMDVGLKTPAASLFFTLCFAALFFLQYKLAGLINKNKALFLLILVAVVYFISMPFFSSDVFLYTFKGKIQAELALNPYEPVAYFDTPYLLLSPWIFVPLAYGPLTNLVFKVFYFSDLSPFLNMYVLKTVFLIFFAAMIGFAFKYCAERNFVFFALSPFVLIEGVLTAHLDIMPLFFLILAFYFLKKGNFPLSFLFLGITPAFKFIYALFVLPFFIESVRKKSRFYLDILYFVLPVLLSTLFFPGIIKYIDAIKYVGSLDSVSCLNLFAQVKFGEYFFFFLTGVAFVTFFLYFMKRKIDVLRFCYILFLFFLLYDKIFQPWHIFPLYALKLFLKDEKFDYFGLVAFTGVYSVFFLFYQWNPLQNLFSTIIILLGLAFVIVSEFLIIKNGPFVVARRKKP